MEFKNSEASVNSWRLIGCDDVMVDTGMLLQLASKMQSDGKDRVPLQYIIQELMHIGSGCSENEKGPNSALDESMASSISSTAPSPHFGASPFGAESEAGPDRDRDVSMMSEHPVFSFKTPMKTFKADREHRVEDDDAVQMEEDPAAAPAAPAQAAFGLPIGVPFAAPTATFSIGQSNHKAQVAAIKKKIPARSAKKKAAAVSVHPPPPPPAEDEAATPPAPPPSHSSPDHGLDSPAAVSKPFSRRSKESNAAPASSGPNSLPPPPFSFSPVIDLTAEIPPQDPPLTSEFNKMNLKDSGSTKKSEPVDAGLAHIAAQFANISFSFPPGPPSVQTPSQANANGGSQVGLKVPSAFVFGTGDNVTFGNVDNKSSTFQNASFPVNLTGADKVSFGVPASVDSVTQKVAGLRVDTDGGTEAAAFVFNMGVGSPDGAKGKKATSSKRRTANQSRPGIENKHKTANAATEAFNPPASLTQTFDSQPNFFKDTHQTPVDSVANEVRSQQSADSRTMKKSFGDSPSRNEAMKPTETEESTPMETEEDEDAKRMLSFAELLKNHGNNLFSSKSYEGALDSFSKALDNAPPLWSARLSVMSNKAACLFMLNRFPEVISVCDETVALCRKQHSISHEEVFSNSATTLLKVFTRKGRALLKIGNYPAAHLAFAEVLDSPRVHPTNQFSSKPGSEINNESDMSRADEDAIRTDVKAGVKQVLLAKVMYNRLLMLESQSDYKQFLSTADDLLKLSPELRSVHCFKASALCKLQKWAEAKSFIESCVCSKPESIQRLYCCPNSIIPVASVEKLSWTYDKTKTNNSNPGLKSSNFHVNVPDIVNACLVFGSPLARLYIWALKNDKHSRFLCAETMEVINSVLTSLRIKLFGSSATSSVADEWKWVKDELAQLTHMIAVKNNADAKFRAGDFAEALNGYREFVKMDPDANLWNAVMYGNKAATLMRLSMHAEAVLDCHHSISKDPEYYRSYLRRARARKALREYDAAIIDYKRYLSAPMDDPGISAADRQGASNEMNEVLAAIEKKRSEEEAAARAKSARDARASKEYENMFPGADGDNSDEDDFTTFSYRSHGRSTTDVPKSTYSGTHARASSSYNRFGGAGERPGYTSKDQKKPDPPKKTPNTYNTRGSTASGGSYYGAAHNHGKAQGSSYRHRAWENDSSSYSASGKSAAGSHYSVLGVSATATEKEIKTAYRQMALKYHPDKNKDAGAEDVFKSVTAAYSVLADAAQRRTYDYNLRYG